MLELALKGVITQLVLHDLDNRAPLQVRDARQRHVQDVTLWPSINDVTFLEFCVSNEEASMRLVDRQLVLD